MWCSRLFAFCGLVLSCAAQQPDPVWVALDRAYSAVRERNYDAAIEHFRKAVLLAPSRTDIRKNLGYTLLKAGETELARDEFSDLMRLDPADDHVAMEYAFLAYETKQTAQARRTFDRLRRKGNAAADTAFQNIDRQLATGIERWKRAVELAPGKYSAHEELAALAEQRDELELAREHYEAAWRLRPGHRAFLLALGRVLRTAGRDAEAHAALLAASRGTESRVAEAARELLPSRYPWVYEFREALRLDPGNLQLRRELAWLQLEMGQKAEAEAEFRRVTEQAPDDAWSLAQLGFLLLSRNEIAEAMPLLEKALQSKDDELQDRIRSALNLPRALRRRPDVPRASTSAEALELANASLAKGYLKDALKYLRIAHENDPLDFSVMLQLGWTCNILKDDRQAVEWFRLARLSGDAAIAAEAGRAWGNLTPQFARFRTTAWMYPMYSSRWQDVFSYAQIQTEFRPRWTVRPYVSVRFAGDARGTVQSTLGGVTSAASLSENSVILAGGVRTRAWHGGIGWAEAGYSASYIHAPDQPALRPDVRGGVSWSRTWNSASEAGRRSWFLQSTADALYFSRFDRDAILYVQNKPGVTLLPAVQVYWNVNLTTDARRYQWANAVETGPGVRLRLTGSPSPVLLTVDALRGMHTVLDGTRPPRYTDIRIGLWYALTR